jgi:hypothetical protein
MADIPRLRLLEPYETEPQRLCSSCESFDAQRVYRYSDRGLRFAGIPLSSLRKGALEDKCPFCQLLWNAMSSIVQYSQYEELSAGWVKLAFSSTSAQSTSFAATSLGPSLTTLECSLFVEDRGVTNYLTRMVWMGNKQISTDFPVVAAHGW